MPADPRVPRQFSLPGDLAPMAPSGLDALAADTPRSVAWLAERARRVARRRHDWWHLVRFTEERRWRTLLHRDPEYEMWLLSWLPGQRTDPHDHGGSSGVFAVAVGQLGERVTTHNGLRHLTVRTDQARVFGPHYVHELANESSAPAVSVHMSAPALTRMRQHEETPHGAVWRVGMERVGVD